MVISVFYLFFFVTAPTKHVRLSDKAKTCFCLDCGWSRLWRENSTSGLKLTLASFPFSLQIVLQCNEMLRTCLSDREVGDAALGLLDMYKRLLRTGIIFKVG